MFKVFKGLLVVILFCVSVGLKGQFSQILEPYPERYALLNKANKIAIIEKYYRTEYGDSLIRVSALDSNGNEALVKMPKKFVTYYIYDNQKRFTGIIDTQFTLGGPEVSSRQVIYDKDGHLKLIKNMNSISEFAYNPETNELFENVTSAKGQNLRKYYKYNLKNEWTYEADGNYKGKSYYENKLTYYPKTGFLESTLETATNNLGSKNITKTNYTYDEDGFLTYKQVNVLENYGDSVDEATINGKFIRSSYSESYKYEYDKYKNQILEEYANSRNSETGYKVKRKFLPNNLIDEEAFYNKTGKELYSYKYVYHKIDEVKGLKPVKGSPSMKGKYMQIVPHKEK